MANQCQPETAMLRYDINDIRLFYENDVRFLKQF
jgi:phenylalanyl-tRNA synthetase alpha subunit